MQSRDLKQRFVFDQSDARGCYVRLTETVADIQATHHYPDNLAKVLNEFALAVVLLRDSIKVDGSITIQLRAPGAISLIMADCLADKRVRAIAEYDGSALAANDPVELASFGDGAVMAITITPRQGERYQSIVPIEQATLAGCLEDYFARSEQLPSWFVLCAQR
ncbi:MAG: redox-regulated molecular chaperone Hsp33, partial [Gammaproteobacteria bacterium]|nr:redox-regulated molecular chaperone Hsp33 [Gammaproteobacteria bacterium]